MSLELDEFLSLLKDKYPKYHTLKYENITAKAEEIQALLDDKTTLLEYFVADSASYLFALSKAKVNLYKIPITRKKIQKEVRNFRKALTNYQFILNKQDKAFALFTDKAYWFYENFLKRALAECQAENLIIVADAELGYLPFETFLTKEVKSQKVDYKNLAYLINDYKISYNYSATLWKENLNSPKPINNSQVLACAASYGRPDSNLLNIRKPNIFKNRAHLKPLPAAQTEITALSKHFQGDFLYGDSTNEAFFKENAQDYGVIHLAMHGIVHNRVPMLSSLAFTENRDSLEDNFLQAYEISKLQLNADLVVLSACETGYGKFEQGEGVVSLARSFMYAGVPSLVVSLWQVNDNSTARIMKDLYTYLAEGMSKDEALRQAKLNYIKNAKGTIAHPAFWSPFVQLGDNRPMTIATKGNNYITWIGGSLGLLVFLLGTARIGRKAELW
ncbi:MAG: CHAT domain-containing protein [Aureispira sp.]|nr:CHAT domain-containing protein [Aureispira sp.]